MTRKKTRETFLDALRAGASVAASARAVGITRQAAYLERDKSATFRAAWEAALEEGTDRLEDQALRRATVGVTRTRGHYYQGARVGEDVEVVHSDTLLIFLLKARRPEKYRETLDLSNRDGTLVAGLAAAVRAVHETQAGGSS